MSWPRWSTSRYPDRANLREVAPGLFVGGEEAPLVPPPQQRRWTRSGRWALVVDLCGQSLEDQHQHRYQHADAVLAVPFQDGTPIPDGALDQIVHEVREVRGVGGGGPVLLHCAAGLSRSASVAYVILRRVYGLGDAEARRRVHVMDEFPHPVVLGSAQAWLRGKTRGPA